MAELAIASPISGQFADELGPSGQFQVLTQQNEQFTKRFNDAMTYLGERMASIEANTTKRLDNSVAYLGERITTVEANSEEWRHTERAARKEGHASYRATFRGIVLFLFLVAAGLIALTIVVLMRGSS